MATSYHFGLGLPRGAATLGEATLGKHLERNRNEKGQGRGGRRKREEKEGGGRRRKGEGKENNERREREG